MAQCSVIIIVHIASSQCNALTPVVWGEAKRIYIVKEHCMARKTASHVLQIASDQNQEVLDSSPKFGISFFSERIFGSGISSASNSIAPIPANVSGGSNDIRECIRRA